MARVQKETESGAENRKKEKPEFEQKPLNTS